MARIPFDPAEIAIAVENVIEEEVLDTYERFIETVAPATPIKTGRAQGNWQTRTRNTGFRVIQRRGARAAVTAGKKSIRSARKQISRGRVAKIYIANPVPYIGRLNQGYSPQADAFFIEEAFFRASRPRTPRRKNI